MVTRWWARAPSRLRRGDRDAATIAPASLPAGSTAGLDGAIAAEIEAFRTRAAVDMVMLDALVGMQRIDDAADGIDDQRRALVALQASLETALVTAVAQRDADAAPATPKPDVDDQDHDLGMAATTAGQAQATAAPSRMGSSLAGAVAAAALALSLPLAINAPLALDPTAAELADLDPGVAQELDDARRMLAGLMDDGTAAGRGVDVEVALADARHAHRAILDLPARTLEQPLIRDEVVAVLVAEDAVLAGLEHAQPEAGLLRAELGRLRGTLERVERDGVGAVPVIDVAGELETTGARVEDLVDAVATARDDAGAGQLDDAEEGLHEAVPEPVQDSVDHVEGAGDGLDPGKPAADRPGVTP